MLQYTHRLRDTNQMIPSHVDASTRIERGVEQGSAENGDRGRTLAGAYIYICLATSVRQLLVTPLGLVADGYYDITAVWGPPPFPVSLHPLIVAVFFVFFWSHSFSLLRRPFSRYALFVGPFLILVPRV